MIPYDEEHRFAPDCSTCRHRVPRHESKRERPDRPRGLRFVCMVEGRPIGEHGNWMQTRRIHDDDGWHSSSPRWVQDVPCKANLNDGKGWFALDYEPVEDQGDI